MEFGAKTSKTQYIRNAIEISHDSSSAVWQLFTVHLLARGGAKQRSVPPSTGGGIRNSGQIRGAFGGSLAIQIFDHGLPTGGDPSPGVGLKSRQRRLARPHRPGRLPPFKGRLGRQTPCGAGNTPPGIGAVYS